MWMFLRPTSVPASAEPIEDRALEAVETLAEPMTVAEPPSAARGTARERAGALMRDPWPGTGVDGRDAAFLPVVVRDGQPAPPVLVYLHPGRRQLGSMVLERVARQFDLRRAPLFESLGEAELAADETAGFLLEVAGPFDDPEGRSHSSGVFFVAGLA